ncbi:MAG: hypothetical protein K2Q26_13965 [Bdellovibrionales bacterium]|nr:hypothetical protein [Bdellovibrionales bacterium]
MILRLLPFLFLINACASQQILVNFENAEPHRLALDSKTHYNGKTLFYIDRIVDARSNSNPFSIGSAQTGIFNKATPILLKENLESTFSESLKRRMSARGFEFVEQKSKAGYTAVVSVRKLEFSEKTTWTTEHGICDSEIHLNVFKKKTNQSIVMNASAHVEIPGIDVTDQAETILMSCIDVMVVKMIDGGLLD